MVDIKVNVWHNTEYSNTAHDDAFDAIVNACDQIYNSKGIGYYVEKESEDFNIDVSGVDDLNNILNPFENKLNDKGLYNSDYSETYILVYDNGNDGWEGQARYNTGNSDDDSRRDYLSAANRYGLAVLGYDNDSGYKNAAAHEMLHTFMSGNDSGDPALTDHQSGSIYDEGGVTPMATGYSDTLDDAPTDDVCNNNGDPDYYTSTLSTCTKNSVEDHMNNIFENK